MEATPAEAESGRAAEAPGWRVREATDADAPAVAAAVAELLVELSGKGPPAAELEEATKELARDRSKGALLLAEAGGEGGIVGVLAASWQHAIHVPGRYGTIQDLWVHREWRSRAIGADLVSAFCELAREAGAQRIEVGLPRESFERIAATEAFYKANGFEHLGPRMRRRL
ncbi:MAG TPA: GNAT family N-acetyltransferase [Solirubrobacterales bacterium]|nr:GNAT family N-acetyltransferase [Solirubrobacterales bacterium]